MSCILDKELFFRVATIRTYFMDFISIRYDCRLLHTNIISRSAGGGSERLGLLGQQRWWCCSLVLPSFALKDSALQAEVFEWFFLAFCPQKWLCFTCCDWCCCFWDCLRSLYSTLDTVAVWLPRVEECLSSSAAPHKAGSPQMIRTDATGYFSAVRERRLFTVPFFGPSDTRKPWDRSWLDFWWSIWINCWLAPWWLHFLCLSSSSSCSCCESGCQLVDWAEQKSSPWIIQQADRFWVERRYWTFLAGRQRRWLNFCGTWRCGWTDLICLRKVRLGSNTTRFFWFGPCIAGTQCSRLSCCSSWTKLTLSSISGINYPHRS